MSQATLQPGVPKRFATGKNKWLIVRECAEFVYLCSERQAKIRLEFGDKLDVSQMGEVELVNPHSVPVKIIYQLSQVDMSVQPRFEAKLSESVAVSEIRSVVSVNAVSAQNFVTRDHIEIQPLATKRLVYPSATRKETLIQNISPNEAEARVGDINIGATRGLVLHGSAENIGAMGIDGGGELFAYNNSSSVLKLAVFEVHE